MDSTVTEMPAGSQQPEGQHKEPRSAHDVYVKRVPLRVWAHARNNACLSGLSFREYLIQLLDQSQPFTAAGLPTSG